MHNPAILKYLTLACIISIVWQIFGGRQYRYIYDFPIIFGMNLYTLFAWALGLWAIIICYDYIEHKLKLKSFTTRFVVFILFYWTALIIAETIAFHWIGFKDLAVINYPGLPICNCIHGPWWMKIVYACMGPIMYSTSRWMKIRNVFDKKQ